MNELKLERELFVRWGSAGSEPMFDFPCQFYQIPGCSGVIAYRIESKCAIVFGDPICPPTELKKLTEAFHQYCLDSGLNIIYITVSQEFANLVQNECKIMIQVCDEFILDPNASSSHRLEHRIEKAMSHGLSFHEYIPLDKNLEKDLLDVGNQWKSSIKGPHLYLGHLNFFESYIGKRWFYVQDEGKPTSIVMLSKLEAKEGWLLKFLATKPHAFQTTSEFLMLSVLKTLRDENCTFLTKGMMPVDSIQEMKGLGTFHQFALKHVYQLISSVFKFKKRKEYWQRYHPKSVPAYIAFLKPSIGINELKALKKAFRSE